MKKSISTFPRFMYLNLYAFLLLIGGIGIAVIPLYRISPWLLIPQSSIVILFLRGAISIFQSWHTKQRKYDILIERNKDQTRPDTLGEYMEAPCGKLLVRLVLKDLGRPDDYRMLQKLKQPLWIWLKKQCHEPKSTVVYINPNYTKYKQENL